MVSGRLCHENRPNGRMKLGAVDFQHFVSLFIACVMCNQSVHAGKLVITAQTVDKQFRYVGKLDGFPQIFDGFCISFVNKIIIHDVTQCSMLD